jgi:hypothetical protein
VSSAPALAPDAAMALGLASTALPFARGPAAEAERWLRVLRLHGQVGIALQALGVSEMSLAEDDPDGARERRAPAEDDDVVAHVVAHAARAADQRGAPGVATTDLLFGVMQVYGEDFDRVLRTHGTDRDELLAQLARQDSKS